MQSAHRSSIDVKNSYDFYVLAFKEFTKENFSDAFLYYDRADYELTSAVNEAKHNLRGLRIHSSRTISFFFKLYGLYAVIYGVIAASIFATLIYRVSDVRLLDVPLWSSLFAGLGSSAQILTGVVDDLRKQGIVTRYKRIWYTALPFLSLIFGYMAYLLFSSGLVAFNLGSDERIFSTMFVCFLTGFLTNWIIDQLSKLSKNM
ncbi:MAG: hypothetical protein GKC10_09200 [Methanosarcinales archaeon]|nr:hypothetical protein [Methanosarcinales archaeon]